MASSQEKPTEIKWSDGEMKLLCALFSHAKNDIDSDWVEVAKTCGYKDVKTAKTRWGQIKKNKGLMIGGGGNGKVGGGGGKRSITKIEDAAEEDGEDAAAGAKGGKKGTGKGKPASKKIKTEKTEDDGDSA